MNPFRNFITAQQPLDIFRERDERMRLVAFAPLLVLIILLVASASYPSLWPLIETSGVRIIWSFAGSIIWLVSIANLRRLSAVANLYANSSTWTRYYLDLPLLLLSLSWSIWCFYICGAFERTFLLNIYALLVYSASRMVKVPYYSFGTTVIGVSFCFLTSTYWATIFPTPKPSVFTYPVITETFVSLYLGLYFVVIQDGFVKAITTIFRVMAKLFDGVWNYGGKEPGA